LKFVVVVAVVAVVMWHSAADPAHLVDRSRHESLLMTLFLPLLLLLVLPLLLKLLQMLLTFAKGKLNGLHHNVTSFSNNTRIPLGIVQHYARFCAA
jgi:hypothetical protein